MAKENLIPGFDKWSKSENSQTPDVSNTLVVSEDGTGCSFSATVESSYLYYNLATDKIKGHTIQISIASFTASDNLGWFQIRVYDAEASGYSTIDYYTKETTFPLTFDLDVPPDCARLRLIFRHEWANNGIDPPALLSMQGIEAYDTYTESLTALNFHKVLAENLPASVAPGTQHVYFTTDGVSVKMYIATTEGGLVPVGAEATGGSGQESGAYYNAYTQLWIDERKQEILDLQKKGNCITFIVLTDIHVRIEDGEAGRYNQVRDALMVTEQLPIDYICVTGDIMSYCQEWDGNVEPRIERVKNILSLAKVPWFAARGNHDYNSDDNNTGGNPNIKEFNKDTMDTYLITARDWHKSITSKLKLFPNLDIVFDEERPTFGYFYVDDYALRHRMVFANSEETHETALGRGYVGSSGEPDCFISGVETRHQVRFMVDKALDMRGKEDWVVSFYSHTVPYTDRDQEDFSEFHGYGGNNPELRAILKAFQEGTAITQRYGLVDVDTHEWITETITKDFSEQGPIKVLGWFGGHTHDDCYAKIDGLNICISTCTCGEQRTRWGYDPTPVKVGPERNSTNYAMSMNVFVVNTDTRTVNVVKLGSKRDNTVKTSSDYSFTY